VFFLVGRLAIANMEEHGFLSIVFLRDFLCLKGASVGSRLLMPTRGTDFLCQAADEHRAAKY